MKDFLLTALQGVLQELKANWVKILVILITCVFLYHIIDDVKVWLHKSNQPILTQTSSTQPQQYIGPKGEITSTQPPMVVTIPQLTTEQTTVAVKAKEDPKTSADVVLNDVSDKYTFQYTSGLGTKTFAVKPDIKEDYKFQNGQMVINRTVTQETKVSVPTPMGGWGAGISATGKPVVGMAVRLWNTSANAQVVSNGHKDGTYFLLMNTTYR